MPPCRHSGRPAKARLNPSAALWRGVWWAQVPSVQLVRLASARPAVSLLTARQRVRRGQRLQPTLFSWPTPGAGCHATPRMTRPGHDNQYPVHRMVFGESQALIARCTCVMALTGQPERWSE